MKKYSKPVVLVEKLFSCEVIAATDPFLDSNGIVNTDDSAGDNPGNSVYVSTQEWWADLIG